MYQSFVRVWTSARALTLAALAVTAAAVPASAQIAANGDIVLHAKRATVMSGAWSLVADTTAADGLRLENPDRGLAKLATPLAAPTNYFDMTFTPRAGVGYHLWIRGKAQNNSWTNDSVYVQFSGSLAANFAQVYRIGTTSAVMYSLEEDTGMGESGWGWQDNGYGLNVVGQTLYFDGSTQTMRVQAREDGLSIDQIVLSPVAYASTAPGVAKNDTTIIAEPGTTTTTTTTTTATTTTTSTSTSGSTFAWTSLVHATASGGTLRKSGGCGDCADAGAVSQQALTSGSVSFTVATGQRLVVGLGRDASANTSYAFDYAFSFNGTSTWEIREYGAYRTEGPFSASDVFKVSIEGTAVKYYRNGVLVYTSSNAVTGALVVDATLVTSGATVQIVALSGSSTTTPPPTTTTPPPSTSSLTWASLVNTAASGSTLRKSSGCNDCADAGAVSQLALSSGYVAFQVPTGYRMVVGLGQDASANTSYTFNYGFSFNGTSTYEIREFGVYKGEGPFSASDVFKVSIEGTAVKYYRNSTVVYTSRTAVPGPLVVDTTLVTVGGTVQVVGFAGTTTTPTTTTPPPPPPPPPSTTTGTTLRVLQWNLHHGGFGTDGVYDTNRVADWIVRMQPDVVMLNELEKYTPSWGNQDQPEIYRTLLQQKTGKTWYYITAQEYGQWYSNGKANMILTSVPVQYSNRYLMMAYGDRSIAEVGITWNGRPITLMSTHLDPYDANIRLLQAQEATRFAAPEPENKILTGDMNAWPDQTSIAHFNTVFYDSWTVAANLGTATAFAGNTGQTKNGRIDFIFYSKASPNLVVKSSQVYDTRDANGYMPSDHRPVLTTFIVK